MGAQVNFRLNSFQPKEMPKGLNGAASMILDMTLHSAIDRNNVNAFTNSFRGAIVTALNAHPLSKKVVYDQQVSVDAIWADGTRIWSRPENTFFGNRRLVESQSQRILVSFTFVSVPHSLAMTVP